MTLSMKNRANLKEKIEIIFLLFISFSPLIPNSFKMICTIFLIFKNRKNLYNLSKKNFYIISFTLFLFSISAIIDLRNNKSILEINILSIYFPICFLAGFIVAQKKTLKNYLVNYEKVAYFFILISLITYVIVEIFPHFVYSFPQYKFYHTTHKTIYFSNFLIDPNGGFIGRNAGFTWEPGLFQFIVNLALYSYIKYSNNINYMKIFIYSVTILTTRSTMGLICMFIVLSMNIRKTKIAIFLILGLVIFGGILSQEFIYHINNKLVGSKAFDARLDPMLNAYLYGKNYIFGMGNSGYDIQRTFLNIGSWESFGQIFLRYGYLMYSLIIIFISRLFIKSKILPIILFLTLLSQNIWYMPFITVLYYIKLGENENESFMVY